VGSIPFGFNSMGSILFGFNSMGLCF
jgi:hypothetical protein